MKNGKCDIYLTEYWIPKLDLFFLSFKFQSTMKSEGYTLILWKCYECDEYGKSEAAPRSSVRKGVLRNFEKFTGKHLCQSFFFNKVAGLRHRCFPVNFRKFLRTHFLTEQLWWLLLENEGCFKKHWNVWMKGKKTFFVSVHNMSLLCLIGWTVGWNSDTDIYYWLT